MRKILIFPLVLLLLLTIPSLTYANDNPTVNRLAGSNRYETAYQIAKAGWTQSDYAILAYGENYPDALAAVPLAQKLNAPILLTHNNSLNTKSMAALQDLKVKTVYLIGGNGVISADEENMIKNSGYSVKRLAGQDRYETSIKIAQELGDVSVVAVTTGDDYADALSIAPIAAKKQMPIILVPKDSLTSSIQNYISSKTITKTYVIGGQEIISDNVVNQFSTPERITGQDKYARNIAVLNKFSDTYNHNMICLATGENFADALAGAVYAAKNSGAVALVKIGLPVSTKEFLKGNIASLSNITVFGGEGVVSPIILQTITGSSADKLDFGSLDNQTYTNSYFGLKITIPKPNRYDFADTLLLTKVSQENKNIPDTSDASKYNSVNLFGLLKMETHGGYGGFFVEADKVSSSLTNANDYLTYHKERFKTGEASFKDIYTENVSGIEFKVLEIDTKGQLSPFTIHIKEYATVLNGYVFSFSVRHTDNFDISDLNQMLSTMQITPINH